MECGDGKPLVVFATAKEMRKTEPTVRRAGAGHASCTNARLSALSRMVVAVADHRGAGR